MFKNECSLRAMLQWWFRLITLTQHLAWQQWRARVVGWLGWRSGMVADGAGMNLPPRPHAWPLSFGQDSVTGNMA
jgi:hypothetical protein